MRRAARIADIAGFLGSMDSVEGGHQHDRDRGVEGLIPADHVAIPDRIETGTWAAAAIATRGDVTLEHARPDHLDLLLQKLSDAGPTSR